MPRNPNPDFHRAYSYNTLSPVERFVRLLEMRGEAVWIDNIAVDAQNVLLRRFQCDVAQCVDSAGDRSCCARFVISLDPEYVEKIAGLWDELRPRLDLPPEMDDADSSSFYEAAPNFEILLAKRPDGRCIFAVNGREGRMTCAIHALCLEKGLPVFDYKPPSCSIFPLEYLTFNGNFLLTSYSLETHELISPDGCPEDFDCLENPRNEGPFFLESLRDILVHLLGEEFYDRLTELAETERAAAGQPDRADRAFKEISND